MDQRFIIETIMQRRHGIDLIAATYEQETCYSVPDLMPADNGSTEIGGLEI